MLARATTRADILRDATPDDSDGYGVLDEDNTAGPLYEDVPVSIIEQTQRRPDENTGTLVAVTALVGRIGSEYPVADGDRLRDRGDGTIYAITEVKQPQSFTRTPDQRLELRRV